MSKCCRIIIIIVSCTLIIIGTGSLSLNITKRIYQDTENSYFIGEKLGLKFFGTGRGQSIFSTSILRILKGDKADIELLKSKSSNYAVLILSGSIEIYREGKYISCYDVEPQGHEIMDSFISDLGNDGNDEIFLLLKNPGSVHGDVVLILSYDGGFHEVSKNSFKNINPWKIRVCDVDGDGEKEISLGAYTKAIFHKAYSKRPFIYNFHQGKFYPKWLGSRLSKPFEDYIFSDIDRDGMDELLAVEILKDGSKEINSYKWKGFGFESVGNSKPYEDISAIEGMGCGITAMVKEDNRWEKKVFKYADGKIKD